jgi:ferrous iron transport protein A
LKSKGFPLSLAPAYRDLEIVDVNAGCGLKTRLGDMGIVPGSIVRLVSPETNGPVIVEVKGSRLALGRGAAQRVIVVERLSEEER